MPAPLTPGERERLVKLLGMLGSDFAGERDAAAQAAARFLRERGLTFADAVAAPPPPALAGWRETCAALAARPAALTAWELSFIASLPARWSLSEKQRSKLNEISIRVLGRAAPWNP